MELMDYCFGCLRGLAEKAVALSGGDEPVLSHCYNVIDELWNKGGTPPDIANRLLKYIRKKTGVYDPYALIKEKEIQEAKRALLELKNTFPYSLEGALKISALGNSMDFFINSVGYDITGFKFFGHVDKIEKEIYNKGKEVLIIADNVGELYFDMRLIEFLENSGKKVYYAVKKHPVLNDLSMVDVIKFDLRKTFNNIISTGTDEAGIRRQEIKGKIKGLWEGKGIVIAKGMANYETISEFHTERPVIHIMKVKCPTVRNAVRKKIGTHIAILLGGEYDGNKKRLL
jgi:damage-control phosphatase, subfamily I